MSIKNPNTETAQDQLPRRLAYVWMEGFAGPSLYFSIYLRF